MGQARFRFHGRLQDFLCKEQRGLRWLQYDYRGAPSLKHAIETFGVPHPEVGAPDDLRRPIQDGEDVDVRERVHTPLTGGEELRFVLDCHLGRLAKYLRILGFDTLYAQQADDGWLATVSHDEGRVLLTMDRGLLMRALVDRAAFVRAALPKNQLLEILTRFNLADHVRPLRRCLRCNALLEHVAKDEVIDRIPPKTKSWCLTYRRCSGCLHLYWPGSHYDRMMAWVNHLDVTTKGIGTAPESE